MRRRRRRVRRSRSRRTRWSMKRKGKKMLLRKKWKGRRRKRRGTKTKGKLSVVNKNGFFPKIYLFYAHSGPKIAKKRPFLPMTVWIKSLCILLLF